MEDKEVYKSDKNNNLSVPIVKNDKKIKGIILRLYIRLFLMEILLEL